MMTTHFIPFPVLYTDRLVLRAPEEADAEDILFLRSDRRILTYLDRQPTKSAAEALRFIQTVLAQIAAGESILWVIALKEEAKVIGVISFWQMEKEHYRAETGYALHPDYQRRGLMSEALQATLDYGFTIMHLHSVAANVNPLNKASIRLLQKHGFTKEAHFRENYYFNGRFLDSAIYCLVQPS